MTREYESIFALNDHKFEDGGEAFSAKVEEALKQCDVDGVKKESIGKELCTSNCKRTADFTGASF